MATRNEMLKEISKLLDVREKAVMNGIRSDYIALLDKMLKDFNSTLDRLDMLTRTEAYDLQRERLIANDISNLMTTFINADIGTQLPSQMFESGQFGYNSEVWLSTMSVAAPLPYLPVTDVYFDALFKQGVEASRFSDRMYKNRVKVAGQLEVILKDGLTTGASNAKLARTIREYLGVSMRHSNTIARTEVGRLYSLGTVTKQRESKRLGIFEKKQWYSIKDNRTRHDHQILDGQVKDIDEPFEVNGHEAMAPRTFGIASEDINCRCRSHSKTRIQDVPEAMWDSIKQERVPYASYTNWAKKNS